MDFFNSDSSAGAISSFGALVNSGAGVFKSPKNVKAPAPDSSKMLRRPQNAPKSSNIKMSLFLNFFTFFWRQSNCYTYLFLTPCFWRHFLAPFVLLSFLLTQFVLEPFFLAPVVLAKLFWRQSNYDTPLLGAINFGTIFLA